ncbi:DUF1439 domain-containing protein [Pseudomonas sp. A-1]|uniref:DUF1439 domain-containing protein n=1 Tax=Pseudomonas sp. A-1 TaxID=1821274 RepID=UPI0010A5C3E8|nr:DUF1439 domain-containing protein [Pseudomonas sp. A-1]THG76872.1 DUF1439 domain-containing protein [Pseudomonas sp. A-1]
MGILDKIKSLNTAGLMSFSLTQEQLQKKVNDKFPIYHEKYFISLTLSDPTVTICEKSDRIGAELKAIAKIPLVGEKSGVITINGSLHFSAENKTVYITSPEIARLSIEGVSVDKLELIRILAQAAIEQKLEQIPIYELSGAVSARAIKSITVKDGKLNVSVGL